MSERETAVRAILARARAAGKAVYGYDSATAGRAKVTKEVPADWDRIAVEGDDRWTWVPPAKQASKG
jgi:hypothetical protein